MAKSSQTLYMVIDVTNVEQTVIRSVAPCKQATLIGQTYMLEHAGRTCIAPPLEGRGFAKLDKIALQYLFWNTFQLTPNEDYSQLLKDALSHALKIPVDDKELWALESLKSLATDLSPSNNSEPKAPRAPKAQGEAAPKKTSTCGLIWLICDSVVLEVTDISSKEFRAAVMQKCEADGFNKSTVSVQLGKWKESRCSK